MGWKVVKALGLSNYRGGVVNIDNELYDLEELKEYFKDLYRSGRLKPYQDMPSKQKDFYYALATKRVKKNVKNKRYLNTRLRDTPWYRL